MTMSPPAAVPAASIGRRIGAFVIDIAVVWVLAAVLGGIALGVLFAVGPSAGPDGLTAIILLAYGVIGFVLLACWLVYSAMQGGRGSLGQRAVGLRLQDSASGAPIGFWRAVWRNVVFGLAGSIVIGYFTPLFDASGRNQGWHDLAAKAVVVDVRKTDAATRAAAEPAAANPYLPAPSTAPLLHATPLPPVPSLGYPQAPAVIPAAAAPAPAPALVPTALRGSAPAPAPVAAHPTPRVGAGVVGAGVIEAVPWVTADPVRSPLLRAPEPESFPDVTMPFPAATTTEPLGAALASAAMAAPAALAPTALAPTALAPAPAAPAFAAPAMATAVADAASVPSPFADDVDATRIVVPPPPAQRAALYDDAPVIAVLTWDDGSRMAVYGRTLYGRNPATEAGAVAIPVRDETLSLSKTHFEIGGDTAGAWIVDRHSTNGTILVRDGGRIPLVAGTRTNLRAGDVLEFGDRRATVGSA
ncbi:RDD family protein [Microbacterium hibisci]|uniref:RDD family protein n=1 Tax=Microbacterium hibisci TaxID=2036000 RepID=UPI001943BADC|nr:RDD family protein [Microbacterium hibisci]